MGTGGGESDRVSRAAVESDASPHATPRTTCTPELLPHHESLKAPSSLSCTPELPPHHKMPHPPTPPLPQESAQPLSPSTYNTMGDGLVDHDPAVAEDVGSESSHASKDEREPLTSSQKKRIKKKANKAKRDAEVSQRSGVHTRFPDAGVDQTSVLSVSVNAVS